MLQNGCKVSTSVIVPSHRAKYYGVHGSLTRRMHKEK